MKKIVYLLVAIVSTIGCTCNTRETVTQSDSVSDRTEIEENYAVVVGVYRQKEPAKMKVQKCEAKGYEATIIPQKNGLFAVVVCPTNSKEEALVSLEKTKKDGVCSDEGWILTLEQQ